jgi:hypothetical protein
MSRCPCAEGNRERVPVPRWPAHGGTTDVLANCVRLRSVDSDKRIVSALEGEQCAECRKTCGRGAKRTEILGMGCSTPRLDL